MIKKSANNSSPTDYAALASVKGKVDAKCCSVAGGGFFDIDAAVVILLDYAFGQSKPEAPTAFFGGKTGFEDIFEILAVNAFSGIRNFNESAF